MNKRDYELFREFGRAAPQPYQKKFLAEAMAKTIAKKDIEAIVKKVAGLIDKRAWVYGTVIEKRNGLTWSRAMYIGRDKTGKHIGTILGTSFGAGFGITPGDQIRIAPEDWEKVDE